MKTVEIFVNDGFSVPDLSEISAEEWEIGIQTVVDFHSISHSVSHSVSKSEVSDEVRTTKLPSELPSELPYKYDSYQRELDLVTNKYNTLRREFVSELEAEKKKIDSIGLAKIDAYNEQIKAFFFLNMIVKTLYQLKSMVHVIDIYQMHIFFVLILTNRFVYDYHNVMDSYTIIRSHKRKI